MTEPAPDISEVFDRRLEPSSKAPVAVAFSGGGDSLMALIGALAWARAHGRSVLALCVDHQLQPKSGDWADFAKRTAMRLGAEARTLIWSGDKPARGRSAAARLARHRLIADAAREAGARVVVLGHTADDRLEAALMRGQGASVGSPREWAPSPVWPQGRGVFLLRPLLNERRAALRKALWALGETWIDDPANADQRSLRARARREAAARGLEPDPFIPQADEAAPLARQAEMADHGVVRISRAALLAAGETARVRFLAAAALSVGGGEHPPRRERVGALAARLAERIAFTATLAGAKIIAKDAVLIVRDVGEAARGGLAPVRLAAGEPQVWDGRFELISTLDAEARRLAGEAARLESAARARLRDIPAPARGALPVLINDAGERHCPILTPTPAPNLAETGWGSARSLVAERLTAACGGVSKEPAT
jgi:tRNA(Ile)-lysidine synthase